MELEYAPLIILLYILAKQKMSTGHEKTKVRNVWCISKEKNNE